MKKGKDITSNNVLDHIFWSKHPSLNIKYRGSLTLTSSADDNPVPDVTATYTHNFGYKPQFMAFTKSYLSENYSKFAYADYVNLDFVMIHEAAGANIYETLKAWVTDTEFKVSVNLSEVVSGNNDGIANEYTIDFILFMEEARNIT